MMRFPWPRLAGIALGVACGSVAIGQRIRVPAGATLHNGWRVTPAGTHQKVGEMLIGSALSPDGKTLAFVNAGYNDHHLYLTEARTGKVQQILPIKSAWNGVAWGRDGRTIYVSGGGSPFVHVFTRQASGGFAAGTPFSLPDLTQDRDKEKTKGLSYVSGLAVSADGKTLFAGNFATDTIYALDLPEGRVRTQRELSRNAHPYCLRLAPDGKTLYATQGALGSVVALKTVDLSVVRTLPAGKHPNDLRFAPDGRLFVSCANSDSVLALDPVSGEIKERIHVSLTPQSPPGTTPNALAIAPDGKTLYVANADNNAIGVVDIAKPNRSRVLGFIPTGWYPTAVHVSPNGKNLIVGSGKGMGTGPNAPKRFPDSAVRKDKRYVYAPTLLYGMLSTLPVPGAAQLAAFTQQVLRNTPYRDALLAHPARAPRPGSSPIPSKVGAPSPIKYVLYILKENRTYDQVLGDLKKNGKPYGNGDPDLTLFGEKVTPNIHELARQYVLLDNLYCNGEVSGSGHPWSTGAYNTDIDERAWMLDYSGRADWPLKDIDLFPPRGRIWNLCEQAGLPYISYYYTWTTTNTHKNMPKVWEKNLNRLRDFENAALFAADLKRYEATNTMPRFMIMSLREDHTQGTGAGKFTPTASVASNDLGVGKIVEACSHSKFWKQMAIFIIEDDGQDGPDHVDAHRTEALVISPYTRHGRIDSTFYNTVSMLRTMELILGLPPMSQYDAATTPMYNAFTNRPDFTPYTARPAQVDLMAKNTRTAYGAAECEEMNFADVDRLTGAQVDALNRILWHSIKGVKVAYPGINRRPYFVASGRSAAPRHDDDDDD